MAKVALASTDGITINEHFGKAQEFLIYEVQETGEYEFLERRVTSLADQSGHHSQTAELLQDVEVVLSARIGPGAEGQLREKGVLALTFNGPIDKALKAYGKRGKFLRNNTGGGSGCSQCAGGCH